MTRAALVVAFALGACGSSDRPRTGADYSGPRFTSAEDHFSARTLPDWEQRRERGALVWKEPDARRTIAVRAVPLDAGNGEVRTAAGVLAATEKALRGLPSADLGPLHKLDRADFEAAAWDVTFVPPGMGRARYERRHVTLVGSTWVLHVVMTAPRGELQAGEKVFASFVDSIREEA